MIQITESKYRGKGVARLTVGSMPILLQQIRSTQRQLENLAFRFRRIF